MIEAPEARILCRQLNETVRGKKITDVYTQFSPHKFAWFTGSSEEYAEQLSGKTIPGLGNGVLQDILYHTHIHPKKKISLSLKRYRRHGLPPLRRNHCERELSGRQHLLLQRLPTTAAGVAPE